MKIKYEFANGTVSEVEVEDSIGAVIVEDRRREDNLSRRERYHCYSLDAAQFEGAEYSGGETPETQMERGLDAERIAHALDGLSEVQRRRLLKFAEGISVSKEPADGGIVSCRNVSVRERLVRFLLGEKRSLTIIVPAAFFYT